MGIEVKAYTSQVGNITIDRDYSRYDLAVAETNNVRCPDIEAAKQMEELISNVKLLNCALESLKEQTYKGVNIEIIRESLVEITGKNDKYECCQYIPIDRITSISLTVLGYIKWDEKTQTLSCDNTVYSITDILPLNKRFH